MTLTHLPAAEDPPFDPDYDRPANTAEQPPSDLDAEIGLLGSLILDPTHIPDTAPELTAADFWDPRNATIWDALHTTSDQLVGDPRADALTLLTHLTNTGQIKPGRLDGPYLHDLVAGIQVPAPQLYAARVRDTARLRVASDVGNQLRRLATSGRTDTTDLILEKAVDTLDQVAIRFGPTSAAGTPSGLHDLTWILNGEPPTQDPPTWCTRTDGHALFYAGKVNGIFGDPECGKTWLAQIAIVEALAAGDTAAMIDVDHNGADHTAARLMLLGARPADLADPNRFRYYEPEDADQLKAAAVHVTQWAPAVLVVDSLGEILPMLGVKSVDNDEITTALRLICTPPATAGCCVITIDHLPKSIEARGTGYAIGGTAKKRIMRGSYIRAEMRIQPAPGQIGKVTLRIEKDTVGELRKHTPGGYAGTLTIDSRQPHITTTEISRDDSPITADGTFRPTAVMEQISRYVEDNDLAATNEIARAVGGKKTTVQRALDLLVNEGFIAVIAGARNSKKHHSISHYRQTEDDHIHGNDAPPNSSNGANDDPIF